jgi:hypothetical protein
VLAGARVRTALVPPQAHRRAPSRGWARGQDCAAAAMPPRGLTTT